MHALAILVSCLAVAQHARRAHSEGQQVTDRRRHENSMEAALAAQSVAETGQQSRFIPYRPLGRILPRSRPADHIPPAPQTALRTLTDNEIQNRGRGPPPALVNLHDPSDEGKAQRPPWKEYKSYRFVDSKTPEQFAGQRFLGAYEGSFRIQFTLPGRDDKPMTVELLRSTKTKNDPAYGAVKVKLPLAMEVGLDPVKSRLVVRKVGAKGNARTARIRKGDIIRAISVPEGASMRRRANNLQNLSDSENGMMMLDEKTPEEFSAALEENAESNGLEAEVLLLIERPMEGGLDNDDNDNIVTMKGGLDNDDNDNIVEIYTDGACKGNPGIGGWGAVLTRGKRVQDLSGTEKKSTNNRMELTAPIKALETLKRPMTVEIYTDSQYVQKGITNWVHNWKANGWRTANGKEVKNKDLWQELDDLVQKHQITWHWVKGHSGIPGNERADALACEAMG